MAGLTPDWFDQGDEKYLRQIRAVYLDSYNAVIDRLSRRIKSEFDGRDVSRWATSRMKMVRDAIKKEIGNLDGQLAGIMDKAIDDVQVQIGKLAAASGYKVGKAFEVFVDRNVKSYVYRGAFLRDFMKSTNLNYTAELLTKAENVLRMGVIQRKAWGEVVTDLRHNAWGLEPYQRAASITAKAQRLARTELARNRWLAVKEFVDSDDRIIGIRILYGGGPCPSGICYSQVGEYYKDGSGRGWPPPELPFHPNCFGEGTEVYTDRGWQFFENLRGNEQFLSRTPMGELEWVNAVRYFEYPYSGEMYELSNHSFNLLVTPNHYQPHEVRLMRGGQRKYEYQLTPVADMIKKPEYRIPKTAFWTGQAGYSTDMAKFMGYYLSEGSTTKRSNDWFQISIAQKDGLVKDKMIEAAKAITNKNVSIGDGKIFICGDIPLAKKLMEFGKSCEKYVPEEIKTSSPEIIGEFLKCYLDGDGSTRRVSRPSKSLNSTENVLFTSSRRMADDLGELILKVGGYPSYFTVSKAGKVFNCWRSGKEYTLNHDVIGIRWNRTKYASYIQTKKVDYKGIVRDVELERNHVLWVRYNGKTCFSGNCRCAVSEIVAKPEFAEAVAA